MTGLVYFRSEGPKCPFLFDKIVVPSTSLLYPAYKNNNQTRGGLGRVCTTVMYRSIGHVEFSKFQTGIFVELKASVISGHVWMVKHLFSDWSMVSKATINQS